MRKKYKEGEFPRRDIKRDPNLPDCVIFDIDGTLSFCNNRSPYDYAKVITDEPIIPSIICLRAFLDRGIKAFFITGRDEICREQTIQWLDNHIFNTGKKTTSLHALPELLMRPRKDYRRDSIIKTENFENHVKGKYNVLGVFEDRQRVIKETWLPQGLFVFDVSQGEDF